MLRPLTCVLAAWLASCSHADLRPETWQAEGPPAGADCLGASSLAEMRQLHGFEGQAPAELELDVRVEDAWESTLLRWFTPLEANVQRFDAALRLLPAQAELRLAESQSLQWGAGFGVNSVSGWDAVYADSLHRYFFFAGLRFESAVSMQPAELEGKVYERIWVEFAGDQAVLWIDSESGRLRWAEFTFRSVSKSYRGVLDFALWSKWEHPASAKQFLLPATIIVRDDFHQAAVHTLHFAPAPHLARRP